MRNNLKIVILIWYLYTFSYLTLMYNLYTYTMITIKKKRTAVCQIKNITIMIIVQSFAF